MAIYANQKATQLGGKVIAMSDSNGYIVDENGIDYKVIQEIKEVKRARIKTYLDYVPTAKYVEGSQGIWTRPLRHRPALRHPERAAPGGGRGPGGATAATPWPRAPTCPPPPRPSPTSRPTASSSPPPRRPTPAGVATSGLEMSQNSLRLGWTFEEVDQRLHDIMVNIYKNAAAAAEEYGCKGNLVAGANIAGFLKIASAMMSQGIV